MGFSEQFYTDANNIPHAGCDESGVYCDADGDQIGLNHGSCCSGTDCNAERTVTSLAECFSAGALHPCTQTLNCYVN